MTRSLIFGENQDISCTRDRVYLAKISLNDNMTVKLATAKSDRKNGDGPCSESLNWLDGRAII